MFGESLACYAAPLIGSSEVKSPRTALIRASGPSTPETIASASGDCFKGLIDDRNNATFGALLTPSMYALRVLDRAMFLGESARTAFLVLLRKGRPKEART